MIFERKLRLALAFALANAAVHAAPADGFARLRAAFDQGDRVTAADVSAANQLVGKCYVASLERRATGEFRYEDSGTRYRTIRMPVTRLVSEHAVGSAVVTLVTRSSRLHGVPAFFDAADTAFTRPAPGIAEREAIALVENPPAWHRLATVLDAAGLRITQRIHSHLGRFVDTASYFTWSYELKTSTLGGTRRLFLLRQRCGTGQSCPAGSDTYFGTGEDKRFCALLPAETDNDLASARDYLSQALHD